MSVAGCRGESDGLQGSFITDEEIKNIIDFVSNQQEASYSEELMNLDTAQSNNNSQTSGDNSSSDDPLYGEVVNFVVTTQKASASLIQRKFKVGYNRAGRLIDELEEKGIIGPQNGSKPREVLVALDNSGQEESQEAVIDAVEES